jgi:4-azaleucine resistance transporter AzlC
MNRRIAGAIWEGAKAGWPICVGYFPAGLAFGVVAQKAGLNPAEIGFMSLLVFAGSTQFVAVSMLGVGAGIAPIVLTTFTINLRHVLMSSALATHLSKVRRAWIFLFAYGVTDESFALNASRFRSGNWDWHSALTVNHMSNLAWVGSTVLGGYAGELVPSGAFGIDYALKGMLICLLALQIRNRYFFLVSAISGLLAVMICLVLPGNAYIIIASVIAATLGLVLRERWSARFKSGK